MSKSHPKPKGQPSAAAAKKRPLRRRRLFIIAGAVVAVVALLVLLFPTLLSTGLGLSIAVGQINKRLNGTLAVDDWSLGYFSDTRVTGLKLSDPAGEPVMAVKSITIPRGILAFTGSRYDIGKTVIEAPTLSVRLLKDGSTNLADLVAVSPGQKRPFGEGAPARPIGIDIFGEIDLTNGEITVTPEGGKSFAIHDLRVNVKLDGLDRPIVVSQSAALGDKRAPMTMNLSAKAFKDGVPAPDAIEAKLKLTLDDFDLASVADITQVLGIPMRATGRATVNLDASLNAPTTAAAKGSIALRDLAVSGDALRGDRLRLAKADATFDLAREGDRITINTLTLDSAPAKLDATGQLTLPAGAALPAGTLKGTAQLDLAALASQLPQTLRLREGLSVESGTLAMGVDLAAEGARTTFQAALSLENLAAVRDGKPIRLDKPVTLSARGAIEDNKPDIEKLRFDSSFCTIEGKGTLEKMNVEMAVDLAAAFDEAAKFTDLSGRRASGSMKLALGISGKERSAKNVNLALSLDDLKLAGILKNDLLLPQTNLKLDAVAALDDTLSPESLRDVTIRLTSKQLVSLDATVGAVSLADPGRPAMKKGDIRATGRLGDLLAFARNFAPLPGIRAAGDAEMRLLAGLDDGVFTADKLSVRLTGLDVSLDDRHIRERELTLEGRAKADLDRRTLEAKDLALTFSAGKVTVADLLVPDWSAAPDGVTAQIKGRLNLTDTLATAGDFIKLPAGLKVTGGPTDVALKVLLKDRKQKIDATAAVNDLQLAMAEKPPLTEKRMSVAVAGWVDPQKERVDIKSVEIASDALSLTASGELTDYRNRRVLTANGAHTIDFEKLSPLIAAFAQQKLELTGKKKCAFTFSAPLAETDTRQLLRKLAGKTEIYIAGAKVYGIQTKEITIPVQAADGVTSITIKAAADPGRINLPLKLSFSEKGDMLTIPADAVVVTDAKLTDDLADRLLARVSPVFKGCTVSAGRVGYTSHSFSVPLDRARLMEMTLEGRILLKNVELASSPMLTGLLQDLRVGRVALKMPNQDVKISVADGLVRQSPIEIGFRDYAMLLSGQVGINGKNLEMSADIPITHEMLRKLGVGEEAYKLLKTPVITVPLRGDASLVTYPKDFILANVKQQLLSVKAIGGVLQKGVESALDKLLKKRRKEEEKPEVPEKEKKKGAENILKGIGDLF